MLILKITFGDISQLHDKVLSSAQEWTLCYGSMNHNSEQQQERKADLVRFPRGQSFSVDPVIEEHQHPCCPAACIAEAGSAVSYYPEGSWSTGMEELG